MHSASIHSSGAKRTAQYLSSSALASVVLPEPGNPQRTISLGRLTDSTNDVCSYSSFALIVIFALSTFETGHPFSAASAYFWNVAASAPGTLPTTSIWLCVIVHPESSLSNERVTVVEMLSGVRFAPPSCAESAIEKQPACAAAISSSGFVPGAFSKRVVNEYCVLFSTPPGADIVPLPSFNPPFQIALALRCMTFSSNFRNKVALPF